MIVIINTKKKRGNRTIYEIRINERSITKFSHIRGESLSKCLSRAAKAVEKVETEELQSLLESLAMYHVKGDK